MCSRRPLKICLRLTELKEVSSFTQQVCLVQTTQYYIFNITERYRQRPKSKFHRCKQQIVNLYKIVRFSKQICKLAYIT